MDFDDDYGRCRYEENDLYLDEYKREKKKRKKDRDDDLKVYGRL